jgi:hypothetical protein
MDILLDALYSDSIWVRYTAASSLWFGLKSKAGLETMIADLGKDQENLQGCIHLLEKMEDEEAIPALIEQVKGPESGPACGALETILKKEMPGEFSSVYVSKEEAYRNWNKWWEERQKERKRHPDDK